MNFPQYISFTLTNACNLRCRMCGQWSEKGYVHTGIKDSGHTMRLTDWKRLVDEISAYDTAFILIRGGEPFLFPQIIPLLEYIRSKEIFISIDTNGTVLDNYIDDIIRIGKIHLTFSIDGPEKIHDNVRGVKGAFKKVAKNIKRLNQSEKRSDSKISKSICFTISSDSYKGLGAMPDVARSLDISSINIVPYYFFSRVTGRKYEEELRTHFNCPAFSWRGFHHDSSGIDFNVFTEQYNKYLDNLNGITNYPFMDLREDDYRQWFSNSSTPVGALTCMNIEKLLDIQPGGDVNFCVDFPDYTIGNVKTATLKAIWESDRASIFRDYRRKKPLAVCYRCGAKYISEIKN